jgi:hypothetical protein
MGTLFAARRGHRPGGTFGIVALALALAGTAACDGIVTLDGGIGPETVAGEWVGEAGVDSVVMTLQQPDSVRVTGFGVFHGPDAAHAFRVEGIRDRTRINLLLEISVPGAGQTGAVLAHYRGEFMGATRIEGTLAGGGHVDTPMVVRRERRGGF